MPLNLMTVPENSTPNANIFIPSKEFTINRCKVVLNLSPESDEKAIETVKSILLAGFYQETSPKAD